MIKATPSGTQRYKEKFGGSVAEGHFRRSQDLWMSSIGLGTYLGNPDEQTDAAYRSAIARAVGLGCNVIDTAANYRFQRSERNIGDSLSVLFARSAIARDEIIVSTKGGYIPFDTLPPRSRQEMMDYLEDTFIKSGICRMDDFVDGSHCMTPAYLAHQLDQSLRNMKLNCIDIYYLHNPESQFAQVSQADFYKRLHAAFEFLESAVADGRISLYGTATWNGFRVSSNRPDALSLQQVVKAAQDVAGENHHFKVVQLPLNLAMVEAYANATQTLDGETVSFLEAATRFGITVMSSASILQSRLASGLPAVVAQSLQGMATDAQRAIQFARSTPGIVTALVGMSGIDHVEENMELAKISPATTGQYQQLFSSN
jgi:aryl-alcohol dehydrogenase-like predicted oxidoreductase